VGEERDEQLQLVLNFSVNQAMFLALARQSAEPLAGALRRLPALPVEGQWANFARNHDELTLDQLTSDQRAEVFAAFGPDPDQQVHGRGLRLRLPTMLDGDRRRLELVYSLVFGLPGTPVLYYGEEIAMADNPAVPGRLAVRTPMQWAPGPGAGFTSPDVEPIRPFPDGRWAPEHVNVADQLDDPSSFLRWISDLARRRQVTPEIGWGEWEVLDVALPCVLAIRYRWKDSTVLTLFNLVESTERPVVEVDDDEGGTTLLDLMDRSRSVPVEDGEAVIELAPYGYRWFRVVRAGSRSR